MQNIALEQLSRITQIALHCPCPESSSPMFHNMGCRHYFVEDRLEELVDEGDSRSSSRAHEHENFSACFTTACGNPDTLKSTATSSKGVDEPVGRPLTTGLPVLSRSASTYFFVCVFIPTFNKQIGILVVMSETCTNFLSTRTGRLFCHNRSPCSVNWI